MGTGSVSDTNTVSSDSYSCGIITGRREQNSCVDSADNLSIACRSSCLFVYPMVAPESFKEKG